MKRAFTVIEALIILTIIGIVIAICFSAMSATKQKTVVTTVTHGGHRYLHFKDRFGNHPPTIVHDPDCTHNHVEN